VPSFAAIVYFKSTFTIAGATMDKPKRIYRTHLTLVRLWFALCIAGALAVAGCAAVPGGDAQVQYPKNIIIMFADGAASTQWELGKYSARHLRNESFAVTDVVFREGKLGMLSTHPLDSFITDSAAAASAMATGYKVNNFAVSMSPDGKPHLTVMETAKAKGKRIGLVTTATIYDASPAAFSVHAHTRKEYQSIVDQYLALEPDVLMGGGADFFLPATKPGGKRSDGKDVSAAFAAKGWQVVSNTAELNSASAARVLGLFSDAFMNLELDRDAAKEPSTAEMAAAALKALSQASPNGFVLFVENENTDTAGHHMDAAALIKALWAFDKAVQVALDFQRKAPRDTLVIVTGDHETGGLSPTYAWRELSSKSDANIVSIGVPQFKMIDQISMSILVMAEKLGKKPATEALDVLLAKHFPGFNLDPDLREAILKQRPLERNYMDITASALSRMVSRQTGIYWGTSGHTTEPVMVGAMGPGAELFRGYQDNTDFGKHLHRLINGR
jgi:alkaline phosphatase